MEVYARTVEVPAIFHLSIDLLSVRVEKLFNLNLKINWNAGGHFKSETLRHGGH